MRLVLGSDLHGHLPYVPPCDVLVLAGDILPETEQEVFIEEKLRPWLLRAHVGEIVATWGNHDHEPFRWSYGLPWKLLVDSSVIIKGLKFHGTPWCLPIGRWAWQAPEYVLEYVYSLIPDDVDILLSHVPPYYMCDKTDEGENIGSHALAERMIQLPKLKLLVCGHVHEARGRRGVIVNVSCLDRQYKLRENPWTVIEI
ncbi:MAG: metallophosphoesterase [Candidatus Taylorbacteria bacterium]|nr:metallophosphoesterase [Candidatus Taylorbacteria bacterium]